jgi:hypothetical protein
MLIPNSPALAFLDKHKTLTGLVLAHQLGIRGTGAKRLGFAISGLAWNWATYGPHGSSPSVAMQNFTKMTARGIDRSRMPAEVIALLDEVLS